MVMMNDDLGLVTVGARYTYSLVSPRRSFGDLVGYELSC